MKPSKHPKTIEECPTIQWTYKNWGPNNRPWTLHSRWTSNAQVDYHSKCQYWRQLDGFSAILPCEFSEQHRTNWGTVPEKGCPSNDFFLCSANISPRFLRAINRSVRWQHCNSSSLSDGSKCLKSVPPNSWSESPFGPCNVTFPLPWPNSLISS